MAEVARNTGQANVDAELDYQLRQWTGVPEDVELWKEFEDIDKEVYRLEWSGITEGRLLELQRWVELGPLTVEQLDRYHQLMVLVTRYRPILEKLFEQG